MLPMRDNEVSRTILAAPIASQNASNHLLSWKLFLVEGELSDRYVVWNVSTIVYRFFGIPRRRRAFLSSLPAAPGAGRAGYPFHPSPGSGTCWSNSRLEKKAIMLGKIVADVKDIVVGLARSIGDAVICLVDPARTGATALAGAARDAVRPRSELVAENALLRQQLIVINRKIKRPTIGAGDRWIGISNHLSAVHPRRHGPA